MTPSGDWLSAALANASARRVAFPDQAEWPRVAVAGDICAARSMSENMTARLVLVLEVFTDKDPWVNVCLLSDAVEAISDKDVRLSPGDTGLSFSLLAQSDVVGPLFFAQLGPTVGRIEPSLLGEIRRDVHGLESEVLAGRRGVPIASESDPRWRIKTAEVAAMQVLASSCFEHLMRQGSSDIPDVVVDPVFLTQTPEPALTAVLQVLDWLDQEGSTRPELPTDANVEARLADWVRRRGPDEIRALEPIMVACLRGASPEIDRRETAWTYQWGAPTADLLARGLVHHALGGARAYRVITSSRYRSREIHGGVVGLEIPGVGMVQVKPEFLPEAV